MKSVFFGGNQLSVIVLKKLIENNIRPDLIITSPDEPVGKKKVISPTPLKRTTDNLQLTTLQPKTLKNNRELIQTIIGLKPEFGIVAAYGKIIPKEILDIFSRGVLNLHPSLLPKYRGPSPIQAAILNNDFDTGVSVILLDEQIDHGPILAQEKIKLTGQEYFSELYEKLAELGGKLLTKTIPLWLENKITPRPQNDSEATVCKKLDWKDGKINASDSIEKTFAKIRALSVEPGVWIDLQQTTDNQQEKTSGKLILKIIKAKLTHNLQLTTNNLQPGPREENKNLILVCENGALLLEQVQPEGKRVMTGKEFLNGYRKWLTNN